MYRSFYFPGFHVSQQLSGLLFLINFTFQGPFLFVGMHYIIFKEISFFLEIPNFCGFLFWHPQFLPHFFLNGFLCSIMFFFFLISGVLSWTALCTVPLYFCVCFSNKTCGGGPYYALILGGIILLCILGYLFYKETLGGVFYMVISKIMATSNNSKKG